MILAIDPGNIETGYVIIENDLSRVIDKGKIKNEDLISLILSNKYKLDDGAIEMVACYGMPVGKEVFDTCVWIGRIYETIYSMYNIKPMFIYRKQVKINLCGTMKAKDSNIVQALIDRFAPYTSNKGKGTKKEPGYFYGFKKDIWQAFAVAVTHVDKNLNN